MTEEFDLDLDALDALEREVVGAPFRFQFGGESYEIPYEVDTGALACVADPAHLYQGMQRLLGDEQWQRVLDSKTVLTRNRLKILLDAYMAHVGSGVGESSASSVSSNRAARRSKQTSNGTTR